MSEGLDITVEETRVLLAEIRAARADRHYQAAKGRRLAQAVRAFVTERNTFDGVDRMLLSVLTAIGMVRVQLLLAIH